jgi:hypothetical protein
MGLQITMRFPVPLTTFAPLKHGGRAYETGRELCCGRAVQASLEGADGTAPETSERYAQ